MEELRNGTHCAALIIWDYKVSVLHCCQTFVEFHFGLISQNTLECGAKSVRIVSMEEGRLRCHINADTELQPVLKCRDKMTFFQVLLFVSEIVPICVVSVVKIVY